jgi:hypothetical protein
VKLVPPALMRLLSPPMRPAHRALGLATVEDASSQSRSASSSGVYGASHAHEDFPGILAHLRYPYRGLQIVGNPASDETEFSQHDPSLVVDDTGRPPTMSAHRLASRGRVRGR